MDVQLACYQLGVCIQNQRIIVTAPPSTEFIRQGGLAEIQFPRESISISSQGLMMIGDTRAQGAAP